MGLVNLGFIKFGDFKFCVLKKMEVKIFKEFEDIFGWTIFYLRKKMKLKMKMFIWFMNFFIFIKKYLIK